MLYRTTETKAKKVDDRTFRFTISDESVDRYNSVIKMDGWQLDGYSRNPIVAYQHLTWSSNPDLIIGTGKVWAEDGKLMADVTLEPAGDNPIADKLAKKIDFGSISATSVGFDPLSYSFGEKGQGENPDILYYRSQELLEFSIVNIPANANATIQKEMAGFLQKAYEKYGRELPREILDILDTEGITVEEIQKAMNTKPEVIEEETPTIKAPDPFTSKFLKLKLKLVS